MWAAHPRHSHKLQEEGMEFLVDGLNLTKTAKKKLDTKINKINIHLHALFAAVEHGHIDRARTILESTDVDVNSVNSDGLSPLDVAVLNNNRQLAKMLVAFGAQEGNQFKTPESLGSHLKQLLAEAERRVQELGGGAISPIDDHLLSCNNNNNNNINMHRASFSSVIQHTAAAASVTSCGGGGDAATDKQLMLWERRAKGLKKMLLGFDQARPPDIPFLVAVDVTGTNSVTVRFQEPEQQDSAICTKFKVQWSCSEDFSPLAGEREILDMKQLECHIGDLTQGCRYYFRVACGNLKGYGNFRLSTPASVVPSSWRDVEGREPRFAGRLRLLDDLFAEMRNTRPEHAAEIKAATQPGETPGLQRRNQRKKTTIKQLFTVASKFQKNLRRGVFLACLLYHEDKVLVTNEDFLPVIEVDETYPSCIYNDFHWLMKVACTWDDVKSLRQDMEKSLSSSTVHFRIKLLQAAAQMQTALSIQDLGQLYHKPIRDSQGTLVISTVNYVRSPKSVSVLNSRWLPLSKVQKKLATHEEPNVGELLMASIQEQITYHQVSSIKLSRGLYLGYLKMRSSVDLLQVVVPTKTPNVLPHCKIRDNPHVSSEEWEWLKYQSTRHKAQSCCSSETMSATSGDEGTGDEQEQGTEQQRYFVELVAATARRLFSYMEISTQDALAHRLYDTEVVDLSSEVSFLIIVPPAETACAVPGQRDTLLQRGDLISLPVQVFEMVHLGTYQREVISRYSRLSCILELDTVLAHHTHREAFSSSEVAAAKDRLAQLQEYQGQLNLAWKGARWLMDVLTFARDRGGGPHAATPGIPIRSLLARRSSGSAEDSCGGGDNETGCGSGASIVGGAGGGSLKRSLLQLPPRDPKLVKSSASRGSWPGPGNAATGTSCLLAGTELSKSEQHLSSGQQQHSHCSVVTVAAGSDISNCSSSSATNTLASGASFTLPSVGNRLPPSRSEDTLLQHAQPSHMKTHTRSRSSTITASVSASTSPLLSVRPGAYGGSLLSMHSVSSGDESSSSPAKPPSTIADHCEGEDDEDESAAASTAVVPTPAPGIIQVYAAYETGLASGTSLKIHITPRTTAREVVDLVVKQLNMAVVLKGKDGPIYPNDKLKNFCLVAVIGARERCLRDDFKPLQLQNPWKKGRLYVRQKHDVLAALEQSSRHTAYL
ncbi:ankyrin repeat and fibronectin type-III domain-containing protein 1 isoform X1 [Schistocerca americana]|uniref:ankyrin repeat and fibronectin type-III domain-containing protein 1 isoform X1 n=2 Tax=Schistocerca americana TaxID=7009 RepID=UPI001F4F6324|nr:ankyrin repeat and fibronectin type-III domain-containing protein 1 isoform X1 [Schistocerca americana]XP_047106702.1 ankyrin repeat and fibronectin type-III domain-containing protein 1 isoform X1 [Schistocerca piceifrons]XP_049951709.1 ankyrin repeat and fibronectin type-III domain-containing protein 1 isoform X1 [Schistocerca serialis cubense]